MKKKIVWFLIGETLTYDFFRISFFRAWDICRYTDLKSMTLTYYEFFSEGEFSVRAKYFADVF